MTLLLKTVWRTLLKSNSIGQNTIRSRGLSSSLTEASRSKSPDSVMMSIESAPSAAEVLATVQAHLPSLTHKHMLQALRTLFLLHKAGRFKQEPEEIVRDPGFSALCQNFKKHARALEVGEAIEATKVLSYLRVPVDSLIVQTMLQIIRCNINFLNIRQVMFLDFIISRFDTKNHLVDALKLALPLTFQIHLPLELDKEDLPLLRDMLGYCCAHDLPDRCINNVVTGLLLHDQSIDAQAAKSLIWSLCQINCTEQRYSTRAQLLHICYDILTPRLNQLGYEDVLRTAAKIKGRILEKHPEYYHEQLMDAVASYVIDNDVGFEKGLLIARVLSRIAHTHLGLVEYLSTLAASEPSTLANARTNILFGFVNCLANNNYTPPDHTWEELRRQMSENPLLQTKVYTLPWIKVCLELASLGHYEDKLLERIFSEDFLKEYLCREQNTLDYLQLLSLYEAVKAFHSDKYVLKEDVLAHARELYPTHSATEQLAAAAARGLGGEEYVLRNVQLPSGVVADVLMCMKNGYPVKLSVDSDGSKVPYSSLQIPTGAVVVCVMNFSAGCFSMNSNRLRGTFRLILDTLEKQGYVAVPVNLHDWLHAPAHERVPYLMREINYKCGEIGMKLSAT